MNVVHFTGEVITLLKGKDGVAGAVYEVVYDEEDDPFEVDHLVEDYRDGSVRIL